MPRILCRQQFHDHVHSSPPLVPILSQINPVQLPSHSLKIHYTIVFLSTPRSPKLSPSLTFPHQHHVLSLLSHIHDICLVHLVVGDVISRILGDKHRSWSPWTKQIQVTTSIFIYLGHKCHFLRPSYPPWYTHRYKICWQQIMLFGSILLPYASFKALISFSAPRH